MSIAKLKVGTHRVVKNEDVRKYLTKTESLILYELLQKINDGRTNEGKMLNNYYVVNQDEPYADEILKLILKKESSKKSQRII